MGIRRETEKTFMATVIAFARLHGWLVFHAYDSRRSPAGFPDCVMTKATVCVVAELKVGKNTTTTAQKRWLAAFAAVPGVRAFTWRPTDWHEIEAVLSDTY